MEALSLFHFCITALIQKEIGLIYDDVTRFVDRVLSIDTRHSQISEDFKKLRTSMEKIQNRTQRVKDLDLEKKIGIKK